MKKKKFDSKLSLGKTNVSNLDAITGGYKTAAILCATANCGSRNCDTNYCGTAACGTNNCLTNNHPLSDPLHCRTCNDAC